MGGTLFVARAPERFSRGVRYLFPSPERAECSAHSHPWRTQRPSTPVRFLRLRYAISAAHVRYGQDKGFIHGRYAILREARRFHGRYAIRRSAVSLRAVAPC